MDSEFRGFLKRFDGFLERYDEDRRKADGDRRKADEDRLKADEDRRNADERFTQLLEKSNRFDRDLLQGLARIGKKIGDTQKEHTRLLEAILNAVRVRGNGRSGDSPARN